jgi:hypothetical protein
MDSRNDRKIEWTVVRDFTQDVEVPAHNPSYPPRKLTLVVRVSKADNEFVPPTIQHGKLVADRVTSFIPVSYYVRDGQVHFINTKEILQNLQHQALEYCKDLITLAEARRQEERMAREQRNIDRDKPVHRPGLKKLGKQDHERRQKHASE